MPLRKRKPPIEDRSFLGRVGAIMSGEASRRIKRDARKIAPQYAQPAKRRKRTTKKNNGR